MKSLFSAFVAGVAIGAMLSTVGRRADGADGNGGSLPPI